MIKVLIVASIIFGAVFSFGLTAEKIPLAEMANDLQNISANFLSGLESLGLDDPELAVDAQSVISEGNIDFEFDVIPVDPDGTPNTGDEHFLNVVSACNFHSPESIVGETCVVCTLLDSQDKPVGSGRVDLDGYTESITIPVAINPDVQGQNSVFTVKKVELKICDEGEGCDVEFWISEPPEWDNIPVNQNTSFKVAFFGSDDAEPSFQITLNNNAVVTHPTLLQALDAKTELGGLNALVPQAVAALLNSQSSIDFNLSPTEVSENFNIAYATADPLILEALATTFASYNNLECPLPEFSNGAE